MNSSSAGKLLIAAVVSSVAVLPAASPAHAAFSEAALSQYTVSDVAEKVAPAVVAITTEVRPQQMSMHGRRGGRPAPGEMPDNPFHFFFGPNMPFEIPQRPEMGIASGVIISADGFVVTNNHVVHSASEIRAKLSDGREFSAKLIGTDESSDIALIKVDAKDLPYLKLGDSSKIRLGEFVLAIGNPFGVGETVTMGIVSAKGRSNVGIVDYEDFIQTDAAINPGNSGGALVNLQGELVGVNTAILSKSGGFAGIGFAVPSNMVKPIIDQIREHGHVRRGWLGVAIQDLTPELAKGLDIKQTRGVVISDVLENGPAAKAGIQNGDVVVKLNGEPVSNASTLRNLIAMLGPNTTAKLTIDRHGGIKEISVKLEQKKENAESRVEPFEEQGALSGVGLQDLDAQLRQQLGIPNKVSGGVVVTEVDPSSRAARSGLREGDVIVTVNGKAVRSTSDLRAMGIDKGKALLRVWRGGSFLFLVLNG
jgi:Do/DeqQ family serine protease